MTIKKGLQIFEAPFLISLSYYLFFKLSSAAFTISKCELTSGAVFCAQALISLGCTFSAEPKPWLANIHPRILIEQDPGFSHIWASKGNPYDTFGVHDIYFSVGPKLGRPECTVPTFGIEWWPVWNPVILDWWDPAKLISRNRFTTVAGWWTQQYQEFDGKIYGPKAEEMKKFIDLPMKINETMEIAMETRGA